MPGIQFFLNTNTIKWETTPNLFNANLPMDYSEAQRQAMGI